MTINVELVDYTNAQHAQALCDLLDAYAADPMGGGTPLQKKVKQNLVTSLAEVPGAFSLLAWDHSLAIGLVNAFQSFSTFACQPIINIHDFALLKQFRGQGISQLMLQKVEQIAQQRGCCKITLEVLSNNLAAKAAYKKFGFVDYQLEPEAGTALFWQKSLP